MFALTSGTGPREKLCVPSTWAAFEGCEVGNKVKLDCAGEVARRWGIGGGAGDFRKPYISASISLMLVSDRRKSIHLHLAREDCPMSWPFWPAVRVFGSY